MNHRDQWIDDHLARLGERVTQRDTVRSGVTGYVLAVETGRQRYYFKVCTPMVAHEPALTAALADWMPGQVPDVLAVDADRGWLLMADAGPTVRSLIQADGDRSRSDEMLRRMAALQQAAVPYADQIAALGVPDRRLDVLPALYEQVIADTDILLIDQPDGLPVAEAAQLSAFTDTVRALCEQAAAVPIPATLHHDDFHTGNVSASYHVFDWGESTLAHPFFSLLIALRDAKFVLDYDEAALTRMRDVYLECWTDYAPLNTLRDLVPVTHQLAALCRTLTWRHVVTHASEADKPDLADAVPYWLRTFLTNNPLTLLDE